MNMRMNISGDHESRDQGPRVRELTEEENWQLLERARFARLVTVDEGDIDITPLNIVVSDQRIYFRTAAGSKLTKLQLNPSVALETDRIEGGVAQSVVVKGEARLLTDPEETARAAELPLTPWVHTEKIEIVEVAPRTVTGRWFRLGE